jgi:hypothetical protein
LHWPSTKELRQVSGKKGKERGGTAAGILRAMPVGLDGTREKRWSPKTVVVRVAEIKIKD